MDISAVNKEEGLLAGIRRKKTGHLARFPLYKVLLITGGKD